MCYTMFMKSHGIYFRNRVINYVEAGHYKKETCQLFGISTNTLYLLEKQLKELGHLERQKRKPSPRKLPLDKLEAFVNQYPDAFLRGIAEYFDCSILSVWVALKKLNITFKKKTTTYKEQDSEKVRRYLDVLDCFPNTPIVYIDENGIDTYLYRQKARAVRGQKVYDKVSGRRFERGSVVGEIVSHIVAPLLYHGTMIAKLFMTWYQKELLPCLSESHLIIMDNTAFHLKMYIDEYSIANGHYFLPLPPYSPELNPIEQFWSTLKRKVTEWLRIGRSVLSSLEYYFKTK